LQGCKLWKKHIYGTQTGMFSAIELIEHFQIFLFKINKYQLYENRPGKASLFTFYTQWQFKVLYIEEIKIIKRNQNNSNSLE